MKNKIIKFLTRGLVFGGLGPVVYGIVMLILYLCKVETTIDGLILFKGIVSTYMLGFICGGVSLVWQEEKIGIIFQSLIHGFSLYIGYLIMYIFNNWLPRDIEFVLIFTGCFVGLYLLIWLMVYVFEKRRAKKFTSYLK